MVILKPALFRSGALVGMLAGALSACGVLPDSALRYASPDLLDREREFAAAQPSDFSKALADGYWELARDAHEEDGNAWDASAYVSRALRVQAGEEVRSVDPREVQAFRPDTHDAEAVFAEVSIVVARNRKARPAACARAQLLWDNWIEEERERTLSYTAPEAVFAALQEAILACRGPEPVPAAEPEPEPVVGQTPEPEWPPRVYRILFAFDSSELSKEAMQQIDVAASDALASKGSLAVVGHADRAGAEEYNLALSVRRANMVREGLIAAGISPENIAVDAKGEMDPAVATADGERRAVNRRVVVMVSSGG